LRLVGAVSQGSGVVNEDGFGFVEAEGTISSAWIFDGVTGINGGQLLPGGSDAAWIIGRAHQHLQDLAVRDLGLTANLQALVTAVIADWQRATAGLAMPADYDPPAACLILAKRYGDGWQALRLGDSCLLAGHQGSQRIIAASPNNAFDDWLSREARKRRAAGVLDIKALLTEFRPQLIASRRKRNQPGGYSIFEADAAALAMPEFFDLGQPDSLLLCTDGFYRAVDHYGLHDDASLLAASSQSGGVEQVLAELRTVEADDPACERYLRFKPGDDATAVMMQT
jgi:hypothetical protein